MAKKEEVFKKIQDKMTISTEELNKIYSDVEKAFKDRGASPSPDQILTKILTYLTPALRSSATKHTGVFLGVDDNFGFNQITDKVKYDSMRLYQEDKESAVANRAVKVDESGKVIPLWHVCSEANVADFKLGRPIVDDDYSATAYFIIDSVNGASSVKTMQLRGQRRLSVMENSKDFIGKRVSFMAIDKEKGLNDSKYTVFNIEEEQSKDSLPNLLQKHAAKSCVQLSKISSFYDKNAENIRNTPVFIKCSTAQVIVSETRDNSVVGTADPNYTGQFFIYVPKFLGVPKENCDDVIFGGRLRKSENNPESPFSLNAFMFYEPPQIGIVLPESLTKYKLIEEVGDSKKSLEAMKLSEDW